MGAPGDEPLDLVEGVELARGHPALSGLPAPALEDIVLEGLAEVERQAHATVGCVVAGADDAPVVQSEVSEAPPLRRVLCEPSRRSASYRTAGVAPAQRRAVRRSRGLLRQRWR